ncbi:zinc ribbon domain-containing protein, partial [Gammaproteobacteria bacterium]|nr:zinc ribbon domain-containing protein [Gammaproteobacteria bacterium]
MPIYDYKCSNCEHQFELIQKFSDQPAEICPQCSQKSV